MAESCQTCQKWPKNQILLKSNLITRQQLEFSAAEPLPHFTCTSLATMQASAQQTPKDLGWTSILQWCRRRRPTFQFGRLIVGLVGLGRRCRGLRLRTAGADIRTSGHQGRLTGCREAVVAGKELYRELVLVPHRRPRRPPASLPGGGMGAAVAATATTIL